MIFDDFVLDVMASPREASGARRYRAQVVTSPAGGSGWTSITLPSRDRLRETAHLFAGGRDFERAGEPSRRAEDVLRDLGHELREGVLQGAVGARWAASEALCGEGRSLRFALRLHVDGGEAGDLHLVPWEALRPERSGEATVLEPRRSVVRQLVVGGTRTPPPRPARLRVLAVSAGDLPDLPALDFAAEMEGLRRGRGGDPGVELQVETGVGLRRLARLLEERRCHVLHVMAHGGAEAPGGCLYLPDERGRLTVVDGESFAAAVHPAVDPSGGADAPAAGLRLVFLNACRTAEVTEASPFTAVATALVTHAKVPAVIAMQYPIRDAAAVASAEEVYRHLAAGATVDDAVREGRRVLKLDGGAQWVVPVLYSSLDGGRLFAAPAAEGAGGEVRRSSRWRDGAVLALGLLIGALALWLAVAYLGPPAGLEAPPAEVPSNSFILVDGDTWELPGDAGSLSVDFPEETEGAILTLEVDGASEEHLVLGADTYEFLLGDQHYSVEVEWVDAPNRRLHLEPPRRRQAE